MARAAGVAPWLAGFASCTPISDPMKAIFAAVHESAFGRYCCKSPKLPGDNFPAVRRSDRRSPICVVSMTLPRSPVSLSSGAEVPHIFTRKSRLQPGEFLITSAKRLLQQYRHKPDIPGCLLFVRFRVDCAAKLDCSWRSGSAVNFGRALVQLSR